MRLLICTQAVDANDTALGFFNAWLQKFARECESVTIICLRKGAHSLPSNVEVISLGETRRILRALEVCTIAWGRRKSYDAVFVHMNPEYLVVAGWLWRLLRKRTSLWYVHKSVDPKLRVGARFADVIFTATKESFRIPSPRVHIVGHGIDTDFFSPDPHATRGTHVLSAGRLDASKHHDLVIRAAAIAKRPLRIAGTGSEMELLKKLAGELGADVTFLGGLSQEKMRDEFRSASHFVHASTTGGLDKVVLEAAACDCNVITTVDWLHNYIPVASVVATPEAIAEAIMHTAHKSSDRVERINKEHSLANLIPKILSELV